MAATQLQGMVGQAAEWTQWCQILGKGSSKSRIGGKYVNINLHIKTFACGGGGDRISCN